MRPLVFGRSIACFGEHFEQIESVARQGIGLHLVRGKRIQSHAMQPVGARPGSESNLDGLDTGILRGNLA